MTGKHKDRIIQFLDEDENEYDRYTQRQDHTGLNENEGDR
jgi:hypothetical protein